MTTWIAKQSRLTIVCVCLAAFFASLPWLRNTPAHAGEAKEGSPATSLTKEVIAAYGGEEALARITSVYAKGSIEGSSFRSGSPINSGENRIAETTVTEIQTNREMPDSLFQP
jgi:hypothetical protein